MNRVVLHTMHSESGSRVVLEIQLHINVNHYPHRKGKQLKTDEKHWIQNK